MQCRETSGPSLWAEWQRVRVSGSQVSAARAALPIPGPAGLGSGPGPCISTPGAPVCGAICLWALGGAVGGCAWPGAGCPSSHSAHHLGSVPPVVLGESRWVTPQSLWQGLEDLDPLTPRPAEPGPGQEAVRGQRKALWELRTPTHGGTLCLWGHSWGHLTGPLGAQGSPWAPGSAPRAPALSRFLCGASLQE